MRRLDKTERLGDPVARNALVAIAVVLVGAAIYWLRDILTPLALAIFLLLMIDSLARLLEMRARWLPRWAPMPLALAISVILFIVTAVIVAENAAGFANKLIGYGPKLNGLLARISDVVGVGFPSSLDQVFDRLNPTRYVGSLAQGLQSFASNAAFVLIYLGFLIASRAGSHHKAGRLFPDPNERRGAGEAFARIRNGVERYLWIQTVTGAVIAAGSWAIMAAVGLDNAFFWAFLIFVAGYVPIIGGAIGVLLPPLFALVQFDSFWQAGVLFAVLNLINFVVGNVILPRMQGDSLNLDPVVVLLALAFWGALWGLPGMFLSTPLTVMTMVILAQFPGAMRIAILMSGDGDPLGTGDGEPVKAGPKPTAR